MNQILQSQNNNLNNYYDYNQQYKQNQFNQNNYNQFNNQINTNKTDIVKIIRFFAVFTILFAFVLIAKGAYYFIEKKNNIHDNPVVNYVQKANELEITITAENPIKQIDYSWQTSDYVTIVGDGTKEFKQKIKIPTGNNLFKLVVTDYYGHTKKFHSQFQNYSDGSDNEKPTVEFNTANKKIIATVKDNVEIKYFTYQWNDNDPVTINPTEEQKQELTVEIDIESSGELKIIAEDINNNRFEENRKVNGSTKPTVNIEIDNENNNIRINAKDERGFRKIEVQLDQESFVADEEALKGQKDTVATMPLSLGKHKIVVIVENLDGRVETIEKNVEM